ncbi:unnamed protein product [Rhizopus stolonifer]
MTSQVVLDQIREIEMFIDVWEKRDSSELNEVEIHKPDEETDDDIRKVINEKPNEFVSEEKVIQEEIDESAPEEKEEEASHSDITKEGNVPEENMVYEKLTEKNIPEEPFPERGSMEKILQEKTFEEMPEEKISEEEMVEKVGLAVRPALFEHKPEEKSPEKNLKRIQRKAIPGNYKIRKSDDKTLIEPSCSLYSLVSSRNTTNDSSNHHIKSVLSSNVSLRGREDKADNESVSIRSEKSFLYEQPSTKPIPQSRTTSISSKKSSRSFKSSRKQNKSETSQKYIARTYEEMMRIPDVFERIAFYEKTLDLCLKADSPITEWSQFMSTRGKLSALEEGYVPLPRSDSDLDCSSQCSMSTTFGESISFFLKKAAGSQAFSKRPIDNKSFLMSSQNNSTYGSGLFGRSISRLSLSRSTQMPKYDQHKIISHRVNALNKRSPCSRRESVRVINAGSVKGSISTPQSFKKTETKTNREQSSEFTYMASILPHEDTRTLLDALNEANGDTTDAISIVMSKKHSVAT